MSDECRRLAARMLCAGFTPESRPAIDELIDAGLGAVVLFGRNLTGGAAQVAEVVAEIKQRAERPERSAASAGGDRTARGPAAPLLVAIDHEGGRVVRMRDGFSAIPSMRALGAAIARTGDPGLARRVGRVMGIELRAVGIDLNFAPVVDVDTNPANPVIGDRSLGRDPALVSQAGAQLVRGMQEAGVAACCKHFPGHGDTSVDSHFDLPRVDHDLPRLQRIELPPFRAGIEAGVVSIMSAHVVATALDAERPATLSRAVLTGLLRERLGFEGVIVSDDFEMKAIVDHFGFEEAVVAGVEAGLDLLCVCHTPELQRRAIEALAQRVPEERLRESVVRIDRLCERFCRPAERADLSVLGTEAHRRILSGIASGEAAIDPTEAWRG